MKRFLIPSLLAAGFFPVPEAAAGPAAGAKSVDPARKPTLFERFRLDHKFTLARHSSHRSHSSHSSHRSSAGGGYVYRPPAVYQPSPPPAPAYQPPAPTYAQPAPTTNPSFIEPTLPALAGNTARFKKIVMDVQTALAAFGYYSGTIDGVVGPPTSDALRRMQGEWNLKVTGTITPELLTALGIVAR